MGREASFGGWDFGTVWTIEEGRSYPFLRSNPQIPYPAPGALPADSAATAAQALPASAAVVAVEQFFVMVDRAGAFDGGPPKGSTPQCKSVEDKSGKGEVKLECK
jgi:hypothetical protein